MANNICFIHFGDDGDEEPSVQIALCDKALYERDNGRSRSGIFSENGEDTESKGLRAGREAPHNG